MSECTVRAAKAADEGPVLELAQAEMRAHERLDPRFKLRPDADSRYVVYLRERIRDLDSAVFVAEMPDGRIVGSVVASVRTQESFFENRRFGYVSDLIVSPDARRQGVGQALWERCALWFKGLGIDVVRVHIAVASAEARRFWDRVGASDFLTESWIDLSAPAAGSAPGAAANEADPKAPGAPTSAPPPAAGPSASDLTELA